MTRFGRGRCAAAGPVRQGGPGRGGWRRWGAKPLERREEPRMSRWRVIQAGIVTPKGNASTLDAPAVLLQHFSPVDENGTSGTVPFDRSLPTEREGSLGCEL